MAFSGGMDSTGLLVHLLANEYEVHTLSYNYGQKHKLELDRAKANIAYLSENNIKMHSDDLKIEKPIRSIGEHEIEVNPYTDLKELIKITVKKS